MKPSSPIFQSFAFLLSAFALRADPMLPLVENAQPKAAIVVAADEPKAQRAAEEIQSTIEKMSGAKLPIVIEGQPIPNKEHTLLLVGHTKAAARLGVKIPSGYNSGVCKDAFEEEGFVLKTRGNAIVIGGNSDGPYQGTLFAASALLEKLGCRWYFPGPFGEVIPKQKTVGIPALDVNSRPDFPIRTIWLSGWVLFGEEEYKGYAQWCSRVGFSNADVNFTLMYPTVGDGFIGNILPPAEYAEKNPNLYAVSRDGTRKTTKDSGPFGTMVSLGNPDVLKECVKSLKDAFAGKKQLQYVMAPNGFGIAPPDGAPFCYSPESMALNQNFNYPAYMPERMISEEFYGFVAQLAKEFPDKWVSTMAYSLRETPPQGVKLPPNVDVQYAPISCDVLHANNDPRSWRRIEMVKMLKQWRRLTPNVYVRDYNPGLLAGSFLPERDVANMTVNIPIYREIGIKGMSREGRMAFMQTWLSYYVTAKLLWNSKTDVAALKKEAYANLFGPEAGSHVQAWWDACEEALGATTLLAHEDWLLNRIYTVEFARKIHAHVEAARKSGMTDEQKARFELFALIADHLEANAAMEEADKNMDYSKAAAAAARMISDQLEIHKRDPYMLGTTNPHPLFASGRRKKYEDILAMTTGKTGTLVAPFPLETKFARDAYNEGVIGEWYAPDFNDSKWGTKNTQYLWEVQDPPEDAAGHDYDGYGWYRMTLDVPAKFSGKPVHLWCGGAMNEAWVWVNGEYVGHREHRIWWRGPHDFDMDVTKFIKAGKNVVTIRIWNDAEFGGLFRRGFLYSPAPRKTTP